MIDYTEIPHDSDGWELFARDFLTVRGFYIESTVDRGPDQGKDMLITELLRGSLGNYKFRWLVSCKHFAKSGKSVSEADEPNILERLEHFSADGFLGFYSTVPSSGLNARLKALRDKSSIRDYSIFDGRLIENMLVTVGYSPILLRYFPKSYQVVKPLHLVLDEYQPLECKVCGTDLLKKLYFKSYSGNVIYVHGNDSGKTTHFIEVCVACKGECDKTVQKDQYARGCTTAWADLSDLVMPIEFLRHFFALVNRIKEGRDTYSDEAFRQEKHILTALAQRVLRNTTEEERQRFLELSAITME